MDRKLIVGIIHMVVHALLILGTNRVTGGCLNYAAVAGAAVLGGIYSMACLIPGFYFLGNGVWRLVSLAVMAYIAFSGPGRQRRSAVFILASLAVSAVTLGNRGISGLLLAFIAVIGICLLGIRDQGLSDFVPVVLRYGEKRVSLTALRDTGNTLRDPVSGQSVLVVDAAAVASLTGLSVQQLCSPRESLGRLPGSRLIPFHTVAGPGGMMLAARFSDVSVGSWRGSCLVAFAPEGFGNGKFQALVGGLS